MRNVVKLSDGKYTLDFILRNGYVVPLIMYINKKRFPFELPSIFLDTEKQEYVPDIPHITASGYICYLDKEGVVWSDDIKKVFDFIFRRIESIFFQNESVEGIHREFQYHLSKVKNLKYMYSFISEGQITRKVKIFIGNQNKCMFAFDNNENNKEKLEKPQIVNAIYIPFSYPLDIYVPNRSRFWSGKEIYNLIMRCVKEENIKLIKELSKKRFHNYYILDILLADGQRVFVGLNYIKSDKGNKKQGKIIAPILDDYEEKIIPIYIDRVDDKKTLIRGGAITNGSDFNILLIGCGSVGSNVAFQLASSGFKKIKIVDNDKMNEENIYRHFLGKSREKKNKNKAVLMKEELENRYDDIDIIAYDSNVFDLIEDKKIDLKEFSLIISAIGDVNKERLLNKYILEAKVPAIYTWVEAYGLGGHAVLINKNHGCYNCLITDELRCKVNFAAKSNKPFVQNFGGCLGTFTPYGSMDSMQTAIIAVRLVYEYLINKIEENKILSWKGSKELFVKSGYEVDDSYYKFKENIGERKDIKFEGCNYCESQV